MTDSDPCIDVRLTKGWNVRTFTICHSGTLECWLYLAGEVDGMQHITTLVTKDIAIAQRQQLEAVIAGLVADGWMETTGTPPTKQPVTQS